MPERTIELTDGFSFNGSLINLTGTFVVSSFTPVGSATLVVEDDDDDGLYDSNEAATLNGEDVTDTALGTATVGVSLGGLLTINLATSVPVDVIETASGSFVNYPEGDPSALLDGLVSQILATPGIGLTLSLVGITDLVEYVEENAVLIFDLTDDIAIPICFVGGTRIVTQDGERAIETLGVGDTILTRDNGFQAIRWIGSKCVNAVGKFAPIVFNPGSIGNCRPLVLSPEHRVLVVDWNVDILTGQPEALVAAKHLVNGESIYRREGGEVTYYHILLDRHEIAFAEGSMCETLHTGKMALRALDRDQRAELSKLFPEIMGARSRPQPITARTILKKREARVIALRLRQA